MNKEELRKKVKEGYSKIKNKDFFSHLLKKKDILLKDQLDIVDSILDVEKNMESMENDNIKKAFLGKIKKINDISNVKEISNSIIEKEKEFNNYKNNILKGKLLINSIKSGKKLKQNELKEIGNILKETPSHIAKEMGLNLDNLKNASISYSHKEQKEANQKHKGLLNKKQVLKKDVEKLRLEKKEIEETKRILNELKENGDEDFKEKEIEFNNRVKKFQKQKEKTVSGMEAINDIGINNAGGVAYIEELTSFIKETRKLDINKNEEIDDISDIFIKGFNQDKGKLKTKEEFISITEDDYNQFIKDGKVSNNNIDIIVGKIKKGIQLSKIESSIYSEKKEDIEKTLKNTTDISEEDGQDVDMMKRSLQNLVNEEMKEKHSKDKAIREALDDVDTKLKEELSKTSEITEKDSFLKRQEKILEKDSKVIGSLLKKSEILADKEEMLTNDEKRKEQKKKFLDKKIFIATNNIGDKINEIKTSIRKEEQKFNKDSELIEELKFKQNSYLELKESINNPDISISEKEGLLGLLGKGAWLSEYIEHRSDNYGYDKEFIDKTIKENEAKQYGDLETGFYTDIYKKGLEEEKFRLIEDFSKLKNEIPGFENVGLSENYEKIIKKLNINDNETLAKISKLTDFKNNINDFNLDLYTEDYLRHTLHQKRLQVESQIQNTKEYKETTLAKINKIEGLSELEKESQIVRLLDGYDKKMQSLTLNKEKIENEITNIENINKEKGKFGKNELKEISNNLELFSIVGDVDKYGSILNGLTDDIKDGNTDFINFQSLKNSTQDIYTTSKVGEILKTEKEILEKSISLLGNGIQNKQEKIKLIKEKSKIQSYIDKLERGDLIQEDVEYVLSKDNLYSGYIMGENLKLYEQLENETDENKRNEIKEKISENLKSLEAIKKSGSYKIKNIKENDIINHFNINIDELADELKDGFQNGNQNKISQFIDNKTKSAKKKLKNFKNKGKVLKEALFDGEDVEVESEDKRRIRHSNIEKYLSSFFSSGIALIFLGIFKLFNTSVNQISSFPVYLKALRIYIERNKLSVFSFTVILLGIITIFADKNQFQFININTHLFSIGNYSLSSGNLKFTDGDLESSKIASFYYKANIYLFFIYIVVFYQIVIEFLHKYLEMLKNPRIGMATFGKGALKIILFFFMLGLIFKVNTVIL